MSVPAQMTDGESCTVSVVDLGIEYPQVPAEFENYVNVGHKGIRKTKVIVAIGQEEKESEIWVDIELAESSGDSELFHQAEVYAAVENMGVDMASYPLSGKA